MSPKRPASSPPTSPRNAKAARPTNSGKRLADRKIDGKLKEAGGPSRQIQPAAELLSVPKASRDKHPEVPFPKSKGLVNDGNNCYRNAVLSALFHVPVFVRYLAFHRDCALPTCACVVCRLQELAYTHWFKAGLAAPGTEAEDSSDDDDDDEEGHQNVDPSLCRRFHLAMEMEMNRAENVYELNNAIAGFNTGFPGEQTDADGFLEYLIREQIQKQSSPEDDISYQDMFDIALKESWTCKSCGHEHTKEYQNTGLPLRVSCTQDGMRNGADLYWGLRIVFNDQKQLSCIHTADCINAGKDKVTGKDVPGPLRDLKYTIVRTPEILIIALGCFTSSPDEWGNYVERKITDRFNYPDELDLTEYAEPGVADLDLKYRLDSVVAHVGARIDGGHYIAAVRRWDSTDSFQIVDDDLWVGSKRNGKLREAQRPTSGHGLEGQAQFLVYSKIH